MLNHFINSKDGKIPLSFDQIQGASIRWPIKKYCNQVCILLLMTSYCKSDLKLVIIELVIITFYKFSGLT